MAHGFCQQRHFPAVAQPFRILWAPWPAALLSVLLAIVFTILFALIFGTSFSAIMLPVLIVGGHGIAILVGLKLRYLWSMVSSLDARKTGGTNLADPTKTPLSSFEYSNI